MSQQLKEIANYEHDELIDTGGNHFYSISCLSRSFSSVSINLTENGSSSESCMLVETSETSQMTSLANESSQKVSEQKQRKPRKKKANMRKAKKKNVKRMRECRTNSHYRQKEREKEAAYKIAKRSNLEYRTEERQKDTKRKAERRLSDEMRCEERERDALYRANKRQDEEFRSPERERDASYRALRREDENIRSQERERDALYRALRREDETFRIEERQRDAAYHADRRQDQGFRTTERVRDARHKYHVRHVPHNTIQRYEERIKEGPTLICVCCGGLFFRRTMVELIISKYQHLDIFRTIFHVKICSEEDGKYWLCITCNKYLVEREPPRLALSRGLDFPVVDGRVQRLSALEEQLCSPRVAFLRIKKLQCPDMQAGLVGNVVNVPIDVEETLQLLPRRYNQCQTVQLKFMRKMEYTRSYMYETVRPGVIRDALDFLVQQPVFREAKITVSDEWFHERANQDVHPFIVDPNDLSRNDEEAAQENQNSETSGHHRNTPRTTNQETPMIQDGDAEHDNDDNQDEHEHEDDESEDELFEKNEVLMDQDLAFAPAEGRRPMSILTDEHAEELTFLKIYGGQKRTKYCQELAYGAVCKSEFRRYDRRCAENISKLFYSYKKLTAKRIVNAITTSMRKVSSKYRALTAQDILETNVVDELIDSCEMKTFLRGVRSSPQFWEGKKIELNAMIRQLGRPTFFITFSPAEVKWPELIVLLARILQKRELSDAEALSMPRHEVYALVRRDPITCARYFENRLNELIKFMLEPEGPFKEHKIVDYFWRVEFQKRGSPHIHMITWNENAPLYEKDGTADEKAACHRFIDTYITCHRPDDDMVRDELDELADKKQVNVDFQLHHHRDNCRVFKHDTIDCKYHFPWPLMRETLILEPLASDHPEREAAERMYACVREVLNNYCWRLKHNPHEEELTLERLLGMLNMTHGEYLLALRSSISSATVFLERQCRELMLNTYNRDLYVRHRANMDIQFIIDPYGAVAYVSAYMLKSNAAMSHLLREARKDLLKGNLSIKQKLNKLANKFQNCQEISAQECAYNVLGMSVAKTSRDFVFINTYPSKERHAMIKGRAYLRIMEPDSTDIYQRTVCDYYEQRPDDWEDMCLAHFAAWYDFKSSAAYEHMRSRDKRHAIPVDPLVDDEQDDDLLESEPVEQAVIDELERNAFELRDERGYMIKRRAAKILRYKRYNRLREPHDYFRVQCMLFVPWRNERAEIERRDPRELFGEQQQLIAANRSRFEAIQVEELEQAMERVEEEVQQAFRQVNEEHTEQASAAHETLLRASRGQLTVQTGRHSPIAANNDNDNCSQNVDRALAVGANEMTQEELESVYGFHAPLFDPPIITNRVLPVDDEATGKAPPLTCPARMNDETYANMMQTLNRAQYTYMMNVLNKIKRLELERAKREREEKERQEREKRKNNNGRNQMETPENDESGDGEPVGDGVEENYEASGLFYDFVTGGAGTGKSRLIQAVYQTIVRFLHPNVDDPASKHASVLVCAITGKAAYNVRGMTLHSALRLPTMSEFKPLSETVCNGLREHFKRLRLLIIDEISLVGANIFAYVDARLQQLRQCSKPFGGLPVLVLGDFKQLKPVQDAWVFELATRANVYCQLVNSDRWQRFRFYELTEIMRQRNDLRFAQALKNLGEEGTLCLSDSDLALFDSRFCDRALIHPEAITLFYKCADVAKYNLEKVTQMPGELHACDAIHYADGKGSKSDAARRALAHLNQTLGDDADTAGGLSKRILLKLEVKYSITNNQDIADGIVNGAVGVLRKIVMSSEPELPANSSTAANTASASASRIKRLWLEFCDDEEIGAHTRLRKRALFARDGVTDRRWTPLERDEQTVNTRQELPFTMHRQQFPLAPCEAMTIHKSQGQSYDRVAVHVDDGLTTALLYVALSRARTLDGLYLFGPAKSLLSERWQRSTAAAKRKEIEWRRRSNTSRVEVERMRTEKPFINKFTILNDAPLRAAAAAAAAEAAAANTWPDQVVLYYQNIFAFHSRRESLAADYGLQRADMVLLVETRLQLAFSNQMTLPGMHCLNATGSRRLNASNGQACFVRAGGMMRESVAFETNNARELVEYDRTGIVEMSLVRIRTQQPGQDAEQQQPRDAEDVYVLYLYKHPEVGMEAFMREFLAFLGANLTLRNGRVREKLFVIGDFNVNLCDDRSHQCLTESMHAATSLRLASPREPTHDKGSALDAVFTNCTAGFSVEIYESYFSDHKPLILTLTRSTVA